MPNNIILNLFTRCAKCGNRTIPFLRMTCPTGQLAFHFMCMFELKRDYVVEHIADYIDAQRLAK